MMKGIINANDDMKICLVIDLTMAGKWAVILLSTMHGSLFLLHIPGSKYFNIVKGLSYRVSC